MTKEQRGRDHRLSVPWVLALIRRWVVLVDGPTRVVPVDQM
ncbi:hypothetical protein ACQEVB_32750 [Pseudonocardia sp. CA-107938]